MYKIAVLGDRDSILGFKALGLEVFAVDEASKARPILRQLAGEDYAVIYVTEQLAVDMQDEINSYKDNIVPAVIVIPGTGEPMGIGMSSLQNAVKRAVGADILHT